MQSCYRFFLRIFRKKRAKIFENMFNPLSGKRVLDVGGEVFDLNWLLLKNRPKVTVVNTVLPKNHQTYKKDNIDFIIGSGLSLPFKDNSVDIIYSNSVIEHLGSLTNQELFAKEIMRAGKSIFVQTPNKYFFIEPHFIAPFIHFLPKSLQRKLLPNFTIWGLVEKPSKQCLDQTLAEIRLLSYRELKQLFVGCEIIKEKFLFFTKSFYVFRKNNRSRS